MPALCVAGMTLVSGYKSHNIHHVYAWSLERILMQKPKLMQKY